jgi:hypothetical protein
VPTYFDHIFSRSERYHLCLSLVVKHVQRVPYFLLKRIQTGPDLSMVVLYSHESRVAAWEMKALRLGLEGMETCLVILKTEYVRISNSTYVDFSAMASPV